MQQKLTNWVNWYSLKDIISIYKKPDYIQTTLRDF